MVYQDGKYGFVASGEGREFVRPNSLTPATDVRKRSAATERPWATPFVALTTTELCLILNRR
ncbi:MAG: hypothetical protein DMF69_16675 [Acidobacteria bacterium]|nr:MAG: hypothetical protein DMF69_16675 [Acidobacteriota bacterium]